MNPRLRYAALLAAMALAGAAQAQTPASDARWPERPIRLIVPFTPGSSSDIVARLVAQKLGEHLGQQIFVDNRVGASGNVGTEAVARAEPDGYSLGLANTSTHAVAASLATLPYDPVKDFAPVSMLGHSPFLLALYPGVPAHSVPELIALAKAKPRKLNYASAGPATLAHLSGALFEKMANVALPDVPTIAESDLPGYECSLWQAIVAPAATPSAIIARLNHAIAGVLRDPEVKAAFAKNGVEPEPSSPEALAARIRDDLAKWREVITSAGIRAH
jgi:tripartite-type tricarboxylate transporter receptor subunit TctC